MIPPEREAAILRLHHVEKWRVGTIATQLGLHHTTVRRVLSDAGIDQRKLSLRPSIADPFVPFIRETLDKYPELRASRLYEMVKARGYPGAPDHFRRIVARYRPRKAGEAYLRLRTLPGEQVQIDWGHFGRIAVGRASRPLMAFVAVLSWSRQIFLRFSMDCAMANFLRGHVEAFAFFEGVPRIALYDNLKSAVLERIGDAIRFHPTLIALASHYRFEPRPVAVARGNEKGRVERAIRYVRHSFFAARSWTDLADLNAQAAAWTTGIAADRKCPEDPVRTVREVFAEERARLSPLPGDPFPTEERVEVHAGKTPYVRFDRNDYSIPHDRVRRMLVVFASPEAVRIVEGTETIARHARSWGHGEQIEDPRHIAVLIAHKRQAREHRGIDRLHHAVPSSRALLIRAAERGSNLGSMTSGLLQLLDAYGPEVVEAAVAEVLRQGAAPHLAAVRQVIEQLRAATGRPPPVAVQLPDDARVRNLVVRPHALGTYDAITPEDDDDERT